MCLLLTKEANLARTHTAWPQSCGIQEKATIERVKKISGGAGSDQVKHRGCHHTAAQTPGIYTKSKTQGAVVQEPPVILLCQHRFLYCHTGAALVGRGVLGRWGMCGSRQHVRILCPLPSVLLWAWVTAKLKSAEHFVRVLSSGADLTYQRPSGLHYRHPSFASDFAPCNHIQPPI